MPKFNALLASFLIASCILSACGTQDPAVVVKIGWTAEPDTFNPGMAVLSESFSIFSLIYDSLYELNLDGTYKLGLAESVKVSEDGKVWTFKVRDGVKFHDGEPLTAEDVAFSFNFYSSHTDDFIYLPAYTSYFESVTAPSEDEVVITLIEAIPNMESQLFGLSVLPKHIWESVQDPTALDIPISQSVGSGPFRLVEYIPGQFIRLRSVQDHFLHHPRVAGVEFRIYSDISSMVQALESKEVDVIPDLPISAVSALRDLPGVQIVSGPPLAPSVTDIIFNQARPETCLTEVGGLCNGHPALRDRNVRLALAHAVDKQKLIDELMLGLADPGLTLIPKGLGSFYNSSIQDYDYDVDKANQILDEAEYLDRNNDGIREMPDQSRELSFRLEWPSDIPYSQDEAELLRIMWAQIGVDVVLQAVDSDVLTGRCCPTYDYDILLWEWGSDPDPNFLLSVMLTSEIPSGYNETGYSNPEYDRLYQVQGAELDGEKRRGVIWQMQDIVHNDVVYIIPFYQKAVQAYRTDTFAGWIVGSNSLDLDDRSSLTVLEPVSQ